MTNTTNNKKPNKRLQLDLSDEMRDLVYELAEDTGAATRAEVVRNAISVFAALVRETKKGGEIEIVNARKRSRYRLILPFVK